MELAQHRQSPLVVFEPEQGVSDDSTSKVEFFEHAFAGYFNLRVDADDGEVLRAGSEALGVELPTIPNRMVSAGDLSAYWMGPDEWLLITPSEDERDLIDALGARLEGTWHALTDVSSGMTRIAVCGPSAEDVLRQGTPLDLHPREFGVGHCAQTVLAKTSVLLSRRSDPAGGFDVIVRRSFADYLMRFLRDAAHEHGFSFSRVSA